MVLDKILAHKRAEVAARKPAGWTPDPTLQRSDRSLEDALRHPRTGFILECKKASPSKGLIRPDFDPVAIARVYETAADAISVLTDAHFFQGRLDYVAAVREAVSVPVLCKDFVVDPFQVYEARQYGADAILLMMSVLDDAGFVACSAAAQALGMDALVEVHNEKELERAVRLGARIIGINNRDFTDLSVNLDTTEALAHRVPRECVLISESGIETHGDVLRLRPHVNGFLVGSSLMRQDNLREAVCALVFGRVKVCGLTRREDALSAVRHGATFAGLIFAPASPRCVTLAQAQEIRRDIPLRFVGVFADEAVDNVIKIARALNLSVVQLHGGETDEVVAAVRAGLPGCEIWKAVPVVDRVPVLSPAADRVLFDGKTGGSGAAFDWSLLKGMKLADHVLAGGLNPLNAASADRLGAYALDVNSGVEQTAGIKDDARLEAFMRQLRGEGRTFE